MSAVAIILGIVIVILVFVLYKYFQATATTVKSSMTDLKIQQPVITNISSPTNNQYAYGIWLYVNNWDQGTNKVIFSVQGSLNVYLFQNQPSLCVDVKMSDNTTASTIITNNFPLQKWVYIIVSLDNQFLDVYLDGKLIKSAKLTNTTGSTFPAIPSNNPQVFLGNANTSNILFNGTANGTPIVGFNPFNAYISNFFRWTVAMDPGTAWSYYLAGNGQGGMFGLANAYGVQMQLMQNNVVSSSYKIF